MSAVLRYIHKPSGRLFSIAVLLFRKVNLAVVYIVLGKRLSLIGTGLLDELGRYSSPNLMVAYLCAAEDQRPCRNDRSFAYHSLVKHRGTHAYQRAFPYMAGMERGVMPYRNVILQQAVMTVDKVLRRTLVTAEVGYMKARAVLHVAAVTYDDTGDIAAHDGIEPKGALIAERDIADDGRILREIAVTSPLGSDAFV